MGIITPQELKKEQRRNEESSLAQAFQRLCDEFGHLLCDKSSQESKFNLNQKIVVLKQLDPNIVAANYIEQIKSHNWNVISVDLKLNDKLNTREGYSGYNLSMEIEAISPSEQSKNHPYR